MRKRIEELEDARRRDVTEVQRAQESLANTQRELQNVTRRLKEAEAALKAAPADAGGDEGPAKGSGGRGGRKTAKRATASPVYEAPEDVVTPGSRMAASLHPSAPPAEPEEEEEEEEVAPASQEGMSLRERLARAAAARHRVTSEEPEE
jgi:hypothetical protein